MDAYAWPHNETSTGVMTPVTPAGRRRTTARSCSSTRPAAPAGCRSTSARPTSTTSPRRRASPPTAGCGSALFSPAALDRVAALAESDRWIPPSLDLATALDNSTKDQTYNTPAVATLLLLADQIEWINGQGRAGLGGRRGPPTRPRGSTPGRRSRRTRRRSWPTRRCARWWSARSTSPTRWTRPPSPRCCAPTGSWTPSRTASWAATSCGSAMFPAVDPDDVEALTVCIDTVVEKLA